MMLFAVLVSVGLLSLSSAQVSLTQSTSCDLGSVAIGADVSCPLQVQAEDPNPTGQGVDTTIAVTFNLVDSTGSDSHCVSPRVSFSYLSQDMDGGNEYFNVFEGSVSDTLIKKCDSGRDEACNIETCFSGLALSGDYTDASSILFTVYAAEGVDGIHHDGSRSICPGVPGDFQVDGTLTLTCQRGDCPTYTYFDSSLGECVRDCDTFAIDEYLGCSNTYQTDTDAADARLGALESATASLDSRVETLEVTTIPSVAGDVAQNAADIAANGGSISTLQTDLGALTARVGTLETELDAVEEAIGENAASIEANGQGLAAATSNFNAQIAALEGRVDTITDTSIPQLLDLIEGFRPQSAYSQGANVMEEPTASSMLQQHQNLLLLMSLLVNVVVLAGGIMMCCQRNSDKYQPVSYQSEA